MPVTLPRPTVEVMQSLRPQRPSGVDIALAVFFAVVVVVEAFTEPAVEQPWVHAAVAAPAMLALAWRRVYPIAIAVVVVLALVLLAGNGGGLSIALALLITAFTVGSETEGRASWVGLVLLALPLAVTLLFDFEEAVAGDAAAVVTLVVVPWVVGRALRERADRLAAALAHAERIEVERERDVALAAHAERTRLARELHDVISHSISVIAIQAQAVRRRLGPDHAREVEDLAHLETAARDAMAELRRLFGVLREEGQGVDLAPQPGLREISRVVEPVQRAGIEVDVTTRGVQVELPAGVDLAAYRIVQEALTNVRRHSGATRADVAMLFGDDALEITVRDEGPARNGKSAGAGHGLVGMRERAALFGGHVETRTEQGGFTVRAVLPLEPV